MDLKSYIRDVKDFPEPGVVFKDISPLLKDTKAFTCAINGLLDLIGKPAIDKVVGIESRGFFFAPLLAAKLGAGFVPVRKPGKLPADTISQNYTLEYGSGALEIHSDGIQPNDRVLIHDDVLATGGTAAAACKLVEQLGATVVQCNFLLELQFLKGIEQISSYSVRSLVKY
ncbi:MAG: adenine phosphoribosyltransferase [Bacteroidia bacterium]|nr:adenine phosphoribosyltransferase [Bacteroidia bacterium]